MLSCAERYRLPAPPPGGFRYEIGLKISTGLGGRTLTPPSGHMTAMAADVREFADALVTLGDLRDSGPLTDEEFTEQKERLLAH